MTDLFGNVLLGLSTALTLTNLTFCLIGVFLGTLLGMIPGIGTLVAVSLLFPMTYHMDATSALVMLAGIYYGTAYGGSIASILLNLPGTPANAVACLDGYPMSNNGRAGVALFMSAAGSFVGGSFGILLMMLFSPVIAENALRFGAAEFFSLMLMGFVVASTMSEGSTVKGLASVVLGVSFGLVGTDLNSGIWRFGFGVLDLMDGISLVALAMGLFGVTEIVFAASAKDSGKTVQDVSLRSMIPTRDDIRRSWGPMARGSGIGAFFGTLPGTGGLIASFVAYAVEKRVAKEPERFGKGAIEGVVAPETANNAADQAAFIPTMTLGIPGSATMAIMLGVLMINGITPGPLLIKEQPDLFWGLVMSFWVGNIMLLVLNIPLIGLWVRILKIPSNLLYPAVLVFVCIGVFSVNYSPTDIWLVLVFAVLGYVLRMLDFPVAPLILGFVLGPMLEENFRRALLLSNGNPMTFFDRPISGTIMVISAALLVWSIWSALRRRRPQEQAAA